MLLFTVMYIIITAWWKKFNPIIDKVLSVPFQTIPKSVTVFLVGSRTQAFVMTSLRDFIHTHKYIQYSYNDDDNNNS